MRVWGEVQGDYERVWEREWSGMGRVYKCVGESVKGYRGECERVQGRVMG